jgi:hypothetical protein
MSAHHHPLRVLDAGLNGPPSDPGTGRSALRGVDYCAPMSKFSEAELLLESALSAVARLQRAVCSPIQGSRLFRQSGR